MNESTIVALAPQLESALRRKKAERNECLRAYLNMVRSMAALSEDLLVRGAFDYARMLTESEAEDIIGNAWLQALSLKNTELAVSVREVIEAGGLGS